LISGEISETLKRTRRAFQKALPLAFLLDRDVDALVPIRLRQDWILACSGIVCSTVAVSPAGLDASPVFHSPCDLWDVAGGAGFGNFDPPTACSKTLRSMSRCRSSGNAAAISKAATLSQRVGSFTRSFNVVTTNALFDDAAC